MFAVNTSLTLSDIMAILDEIKEQLSIQEGRLDHLEDKLNTVFDSMGKIE